MNMDPSVVTLLLTNGVIKQVFSEVLKRRRVQLKDLRESLVKTPEFKPLLTVHRNLGQTPEEASATIREQAAEPAVQEQVEAAVQKLKGAKLIEERAASIKDFNTYYVTEDGLNAERELRLATTL